MAVTLHSMELTLSSSPGDRQLDENDCYTILQELGPVARRWRHIGLALGLSPNALDRIEVKGQNDVENLLMYTITEWLKMGHDGSKFGKPTWRRIVEAVGAASGGRNPALADALARKYNIVSQDTQPQAVPVISRTKTAPTVHASVCCCWFGSGTGKRGLEGGSLKEARGLEANGIIRSSKHDKELKAKSDKSPLLQKGSAYYHPRSKSSACPPRQYRSYSQSLPTSSILLINEYEDDLFEESKETILADPTWEIREITQQKSYWGAMTGAEAERKLKKHGGNCYLIRYSERQKHYVVSVMRTNNWPPKTSLYHINLIITKQDHSVHYEIEGTEQKFSDISSLLEFYQQNSLMRTHPNCTLGEACTPSPLHSV